MKVVLYGAPVVGFAGDLAGRLHPSDEVVPVGYDTDPTVLKDALSDADAVVTVRWTEGLPPASRVRLVQVPGVGCDEIAVGALPAAATLCNVYGHETAVAEYVVGMLISSYHRLFDAAQSFREGSWERSSRMGALPHEELGGRTVGIVGLGRIGTAIAKRLAAFDVTVLAANRSTVSPPPGVARVFGLSALPEMLAACDAVVVAIALEPETTGLIGAAELAALRPNAVLVNIARGPVVEEDALYAALSDGRIGGAVLDVWYTYPAGPDDAAAEPSRHDFRALPNVIATPHVSGWTRGTVERRWREIAENLERLRAGESLLNIVHPPAAR